MPVLLKGEHHVVTQDQLWNVKNELEKMKYLLGQHIGKSYCNSNPVTIIKTQMREFIQEMKRYKYRRLVYKHEQ